MPTKIIRDPEHIEALSRILADRKLPITLSWHQGASRSHQQNRLAQRWYSDIARQLGDTTHEEVRADCKVTFGVPILRAENGAFGAEWDASLGRLSHESQRRAVKAFDLPVTRLMTMPQMTQYMDDMLRHWGGMGIRLTDPEAMKYEEEFA